MFIKRIILAFLAISCLSSCVETVIFASAGTGVAVVRKKSISNTKNDIKIASKLGFDFIKNGLKNPGNSIDITVNEGRVLLTGVARDVKKANLANDLAWKVDGVKEVIDEIQIKDGKSIEISDITSATIDYAITLEIETKMFFRKKIPSIDYKITTVNRIVYILGIASDKDEMEKVLTLIAKIKGVQEVVNHIILEDDHRRNDNKK
jgi:osmotically-inducible protein OsmY